MDKNNYNDYWHVHDIIWDTDDEEELDLPEAVDIPKSEVEDEDGLADWLSDKYGWLVESLDYELPDEEEYEEPLSIEEMWEMLLTMGVSEEVLSVVTAINGYNEESMEDILYVKFGYRGFDQLD